MYFFIVFIPFDLAFNPLISKNKIERPLNTN